MKKALSILLLSILVVTQVSAQLIDKPAATVTLTQPEYISIKQLQQQVGQFNALRSQGVAGLPTDPMIVLDSMIQEVLLRQAAAESRIRIPDAEIDAYVAQIRASAESQSGTPFTDQQFREIVFQQTGLSWEEYRDSIREQRSTIAFVRSEKKDLFDAAASPPEAEIESYFRKYATSFNNPEVVRFNEIYVSTEGLSSSEKRKAQERSEGIFKAFENGEGTFTELVEQYSDDTKSRYSGGDRGYFARNDPRSTTYGESYIDQLFLLDVGTVSPVIESNVGYHIVQITDHRDPKLLGLDDPQFPGNPKTVRELIRDAIVEQRDQQIFQQALQELVEELKGQADIKIYEENINP